MILRNRKGQFKKGMTYTMTEEHKEKLRKVARRGDQHWFWKGNEVGYKSLHEWVRNNYGAPTKCEKCGATENLEWALRHTKQSRDLRDLRNWIQLCCSCHKVYDEIIDNIKKM